MTSNTDETCTGPTLTLSRPRPRVVVLMGQSAGSQYILSRLTSEVELIAVVKQRPSRWSKIKQIARRSRKLGWFYGIDRGLLGLYSRFKLRRAASQVEEYRAVMAAGSFQPDCPILTVPSINDPRVVALLTESQPDLVVVLGTEIIRDQVLAAAPRFVNVHAGITPLYRGSHGQFWAVMNQDFEQIGVTLHIVDRGIDTGGILGQARFRFDPTRDNFLTLLAKSSFHGAELLATWITQQAGDFRNVTTQQPPQGTSRLYYSPGLRDYRRFEQLAQQCKAA